MQRQLDDDSELSPGTTLWMYGAYAAHAVLFARTLSSSHRRLPLGGRAAGAGGLSLAATGTALCLAGMAWFTGPAQVSGMETGPLVMRGPYRRCRNPQYLGYVAFLTGTALSRRSPPALVLTAAAAATFGWWVPTEERHLRKTFGPPYERYLATTSRWLPTP